MGLEWRAQLSVGNDLIDADHKHLIGIINRVEKQLAEKHWEGLTNALDDLSQYSKQHFALEEKVANAVGYVHMPRLHESHEQLLVRLDQLRQEVSEHWEMAAVARFSELLRNWLLDHVIKEDLLLKPLLVKRSPLFDPR